jgi:hypothetical protein
MARHGRWSMGAALVLAAGGLLSADALRAQEEELGPLPKPIAILVADRPIVTAFVAGDYGNIRVTGTLQEAPKEALTLTDPSGQTREVRWTEVGSLNRLAYAVEGLPQGSILVHLTSSPVIAPSSSGSTTTSGYLSPALTTGNTSVANQAAWRLATLPEGEITLSGASFRQLKVPISRVSTLYQEPIRGMINQIPPGSIRMELFKGTEVSIPLVDLVSLRRDPAAGTISVTLADNQVFTGRLMDLPKVSLTLEGSKTPIALDRIVQMEVTVPASGRMGGG